MDRRILKDDSKWYPPSDVQTLNIANSQIYIDTPKKDSVTSWVTSFLDSDFNVVHAADLRNRFVDGNYIRFLILGPIALFSCYMFPTRNEKHLKVITHAHNASLYKIKHMSMGCNDLSNGLDCSKIKIQRELTIKKKEKKGSCKVYARRHLRLCGTLT